MNKYLKWENVDPKELKIKLNKGIMLATCDTVIGLFSLITAEGLKNLNKIKHRESKPYLMVISSLIDLENIAVCNFSGSVKKLVDCCWPGPLTLILKAKDSAPAHIKSDDGTVAVRIPKHKALLSLLQETGPLFSTSANLTGQNIPSTLAEVEQSILEQVSVVISDDFEISCTMPSTILDCSVPGKIVAIRHGAYDIDALERICDAKIIRK